MSSRPTYFNEFGAVFQECRKELFTFNTNSGSGKWYNNLSVKFNGEELPTWGKVAAGVILIGVPVVFAIYWYKKPNSLLRNAITGFLRWYRNVPPISRYWFTSTVVIPLVGRLGFVNYRSMILSSKLLLEKFQVQ